MAVGFDKDSEDPEGEEGLDLAIERAREIGVLRVANLALRELPNEVRSLRHMRKLLLKDCDLASLPDWVGELPALESIDLAGNPIRDLPLSLGRLPSLRKLGLSQTLIQELPPAVRHMAHLEVLSLPGTPIRSLPSWIGDLRHLHALDLGGTRMSDLPKTFDQLEQLMYLQLWGHRFDQLPEVIRHLRRLVVLDVSHAGSTNLIRDSRPYFTGWYTPYGDLTQLVGAAQIAASRLRALPNWLHELTALRVLVAGGHRLDDLPPTLPPTLSDVWLGENRLAELPAAITALPRLTALDLHDNALTGLPHQLQVLGGLRFLDLRGNRLAIPPEVLSAVTEPARIADFILGVSGPTRRLDEAKLLVVGEPSVGKTSLIRRLVGDEYSPLEQKTEGIEVQRWRLDVKGAPIALNTWDFGGQEIMHATHQFFLTKRSLYVLVIDARQGEDQNRIEYWLKLIQSFGGTSPVLIVGNKTDESVLDVDERGLREKYPNVVSVLSVSCKSGGGIAELRWHLAGAIEQLPHVRDRLPAAYFDVKQELERLDVDYLTFSEYERLCARHGVRGSVAHESLIGFLHDLGTVLCFRDDPRLLDTNILNPEWVTGGVYRLLNSHVAAQRKGLLTLTDIEEILDTAAYPRGRRTFIIDVMKRFELCYDADATFLVPDLLTKQEPDTGSWDGALTFEIKYDVLPSSVLSRLIVRMHSMISKGTVWRNGLVLAMDGNRAVVKSDREDAVIRIAVDGPANGRRGLLTAIRTELRSIAETIPGLVGEERVPVPGQSGVFVPYAHLLRLEAARHETVVPQGLVDRFSIRELLAGVETPSARLEVGLDRFSVGGDAVASAPVRRPWTPAEALRLGTGLFAAFAFLVAIFVGADLAVGPAAASGITALALLGTLGIALIVLRSSDLLSEQGFLSTLNQILARASSESRD